MDFIAEQTWRRQLIAMARSCSIPQNAVVVDSRGLCMACGFEPCHHEFTS